jgi:hypothetical protein
VPILLEFVPVGNWQPPDRATSPGKQRKQSACIGRYAPVPWSWPVRTAFGSSHPRIWRIFNRGAPGHRPPHFDSGQQTRSPAH